MTHLLIFELNNMKIVSNDDENIVKPLVDVASGILRMLSNIVDVVAFIDHDNEKLGAAIYSIMTAKKGVLILLSYTNTDEIKLPFTEIDQLPPIYPPQSISISCSSAFCDRTQEANDCTNAIMCMSTRRHYTIGIKLYRMRIRGVKKRVFVVVANDFMHDPYPSYNDTIKQAILAMFYAIANNVLAYASGATRKLERLRPYIDYTAMINDILKIVPRTTLLPINNAICDTGIRGLSVKFSISGNGLEIVMDYDGPIAEIIDPNRRTVALPSDLRDQVRLVYHVTVQYNMNGNVLEPSAVTGYGYGEFNGERYPHENIRRMNGDAGVCLGEYRLPQLRLDTDICAQVTRVAREVHAVLVVPNASHRFHPGIATKLAEILRRRGMVENEVEAWEV